jgi:hypothetical protein
MKRLALIGLIVLSWLSLSAVHAQNRPTATPVPAIIPTVTILPTELLIATQTPTVTPTATLGTALLQARNVGTVDLYLLPEPESEQVGVMAEGAVYPAIGRYFRWLQLEFPDSPTGKAWVFEDLVTIIAEEIPIPEADPYVTPTPTPLGADGDLALTLIASTLTPGADLTLYAQERVIELPELSATPDVLPTFTPPSQLVLPRSNTDETDTVETASTVESDFIQDTLNWIFSGGMPPILPIVLLAVGGILGLAVSAARRG